MDFIWIMKSIPAAVIGLTVHECAHAWIAYLCGDSTAKDEGRITLNPIKHIDPLGFILIVIAGFGWAKPVHFTPENLRNKHRDEILIALAGPVSNFLLALLFLVVGRILFLFPYFGASGIGLDIVRLFVLWGVINFGLFVFNLIPIPPLDGSHLYTTFLKSISEKLLIAAYKIGTWGLLIIIIVQNRLEIEIIPLSPLIRGITKFFLQLLSFN
jgi:Zn-dependent protease